MNLLLLESDQFIDEHRALARPQQAQHIQRILKLAPGAQLQVGKLDGPMGTARVCYTEDGVELQNIKLDTPPPPPLPVTLLLAMPRPQMIKRILQTVACMGVEELVLFQSRRVEKSFWQSPSATAAAIHEHLRLGLEQGVATQLPKVREFRRFRPFVEDELPAICAGKRRLIAHPGGEMPAPQTVENAVSTVLAIGPEGGFIDQEVNAFCALGFRHVSLGQRILKVEIAVPVALAKLFC